jgi:enoyl-CoA hydratase/carnithine racemase
MTDDDALVLVDRTGSVVTITMNRPSRRNALSLEHLRSLRDAFADAGDSDATGVVLAGSGSAFSSGHDLGAIAGAGLVEMRELLWTCTELVEIMQAIPQVVLARVHGIATAAGCQLVAAADLAVAAESARFAAPGGKGGWFCTTPMVAIGRNVSRKQALELALTGDEIDAATALSWGLVNRVVPDAELDAAVADLLHRATRGSAASRAIGKRALHTQLGMEQAAAYRYAVEVMAAASQLEDAQEGMSSFVEKRPPIWKHR